MAEAAHTKSFSPKRIGFDPGYLQQFEDKTFIEGAQTRRRLVNFFVLLLLATVIATYGLLSNSSATVIGAMIVAPLMGPIMATTAAVVMGSLPRAGRALLLVLAGVAAVILFSILLAWLVPDVAISFTENGELAARISPGLYALLTALGAGAAGAFITSRAEISDSMGGVAIAISLVPPLCVVGIAISVGNWAAAGGAMLLFTTNFLAILLAGGVTYLLLGLGQVAQDAGQERLRRNSFILIALATLLVAIPLSITSYQSVVQRLQQNTVANATNLWLSGTTYRLYAVNVDGEAVLITVQGSGALKPLADLGKSLEIKLRHPVIVSLTAVPTEIQTYKSPGSP